MNRRFGTIALVGAAAAVLLMGTGSASRAQGFGPDRYPPGSYRPDPYRQAVPPPPGPGWLDPYAPAPPPIRGYTSYRPGFEPLPRPAPIGRRGNMLLQVSGQLVAEVDDFLAAFATTAHVVPQGRQMQTDANRLLDAAVELDLALRRGVDPRRLESLAREVDRHSNRLINRVDRVARGRIGPNIAQVYRIGAIAEDLRRAVQGV